MTTFNPAQHDRDAGGKFTTMRRGELDVKLRFERTSRRRAGAGLTDADVDLMISRPDGPHGAPLSIEE
jgi:hypothetical protein